MGTSHRYDADASILGKKKLNLFEFILRLYYDFSTIIKIKILALTSSIGNYRLMKTSSSWDPAIPFKVGDWTVDPDSGRLQQGADEVKLEPKVMKVLVYLAQHPGKVVAREELEEKIWTGMIVGYDAVSGSIIKLRKALGDNSRNPQYIETVSKKGYRLIAPVTEPVAGIDTVTNPDPTEFGNKPESDEDLEPRSRESTESRNRSRAPFIITALLTIGVILGVNLMTDNDSNSRTGSEDSSEKSENTIAASNVKPSIIVLPFKNLSDDPQQEYFSDGITDDLITDLSQLDSLRVIARQSSYHYKNNPTALEDIANQLKVLYIIEGSVRKSGERIRVNVQLTNTDKGESVWAERFDAATNDIFQIQDDITKNVMSAMVVTLTGEQRRTRATSSFEAYDAFLLGQQHIRKRNKQGYDQSMNAYRHAIEIDPAYARAYGAMAVTLTRGYRYQWTDLSLAEAKQRALELANKAIELDQSNPHIYWSLGYVHLHRHEYAAAEIAAETSVKLSPNYADGYALLANIANWRGKPDDAIRHIKKAITLNPHYTFQYPSTLGTAYFLSSQHKDAIINLEEALSRNESALNPRLFLVASYIQLNKTEEAIWEIEQISANYPDVTLSSLGTQLPFENEIQLNALLADLKKAGFKK